MTELNISKLIEVVDPVAGDFREVTPDPVPVPPLRMQAHNGRTMTLHEAALATTQFPQLLRQGLRPLLFSQYEMEMRSSDAWIDEQRSNSQFETGIEANTLGTMPIVPEGAPYPRIQATLDRSVQIENKKYGAILPITWEMVRYDRVGIIRDLIADRAAAMVHTEEEQAYAVMTTTGNYTNSNTGTVTFSAVGLDTGLKAIRTQTDSKSGRKYNLRPDTLVCGVGNELAAKQLLASPFVGGMGDKDATVKHGTGTTNPFRGLIRQIVVSPWLGQYEWCLTVAGKGIRKFVVEDLELLEQDAAANRYAYINEDSLLYRVRKVMGFGMWNDKFMYFSDSTTAPTIT